VYVLEENCGLIDLPEDNEDDEVSSFEVSASPSEPTSSAPNSSNSASEDTSDGSTDDSKE